MSLTPRRLLLHLSAAPLAGLALATLIAQRALPERLQPALADTEMRPVLDRGGEPLSAHYQQRWNTADRLPLEQVPAFLRTAIVAAEDRRFWQHGGVDWRARASAIRQGLAAGHAVRGASTISEQVVRLLHPRPRTLWSRWVEGFEAMRLEARFGKSEILEFYLDQLPYGAQRRGIRQAARHYFGREPATLSAAEMLALAVMPRAPSRLDPLRAPARLQGPMQRVAARMVDDGLLTADQAARLVIAPQSLRAEDDDLPAAHFIAELRRRAPPTGDGPLRASLDSRLQRDGQQLLDQRLRDLSRVGVRQGALLVVDLDGNKVRAWNIGNLDADDPETGIDTVQTPRQPGSALKPFVYALALESGWTAATPIADDGLAAHVGDGLHPYRNYSRLSYGRVTLREALGNSLNVPALHALQFVGGERFLALLRRLGMSGLSQHPDVYGDGIALGNGEVSLAQLVGAYAALANQGRARPLSLFEDGLDAQASTPALSRDSASIITDILSDPRARLLEFGDGGLLRFPAQTAVKTGTSSDYRDAWCLAYDGRYVVGAWMGALGGQAMDGVTGSIGPALLVRSVFGLLNGRQGRHQEPRPLQRSPNLQARTVSGPDGGERLEWFAPGTAPESRSEASGAIASGEAGPPRLLQPFEGLRMAIDPRVPPEQQALEFLLAGVPKGSLSGEGAQPVAGGGNEVIWIVDEAIVARTPTGRWQWPLSRGEHTASARSADGRWQTPTVGFRVK